ncbi:MAG: ribonuclease J [Eubacteriales bacterium]|nr:ribonuclease J [Eubacteriales bacterium]
MANKLKIIPLGGVGEIGKNMTVIEYNGDLIVVDCGLIFPDDEMPGIDIVIPDMEYLEENRQKLRGFLITHGHEDHIGALPYALKEFDVPVYGTAFTIALIEHKLGEAHVPSKKLVCVKPGDHVELGCFKVEFIKTGHSIAGAVALAINTPIGTIIHTGDFKVDFTPIDGEPIDINRFAYYGSHGVLALMSDSTNIESPGHTQSEREIGPTFEHYFDMAQGRIIVASFASNVYRIQQVADYAVSHGRVLCFQGRSMEQVVEIASRLGYLKIPQESVVKVDQLKRYRDDQVCVITTGSQGEPMSGLFRMATATHRLNIGKGDMVIISASAIPGNERDVSRVINQLYQKGAEVVYNRMADVHVSGHACREELRLMMQLTKPKYFIPVHGEYRHLFMHGKLAEEMGVLPENVFIAECGDVIELTHRSGRKSGNVPSGSVMVDGIGDIDDIVLKDRKTLSQDGLVVAVLTIDCETGRMLAAPEIISRGFVYMRDSEELITETKALLIRETRKFEGADRSDYANIKSGIRNSIKSFLKNKTKRTPMILPIVIEI